jgi:hypothetical protein
MVLYTCEICSKEFNKKSNYLQHIENKKKPCKIINDDILEKTPKNTKILQESTKKHQITPIVEQQLLNIPKNINELIEIKTILNNDNLEPEHMCKFCYKIFSNNFSLNRHLKDRCKVRKIDKEKKEEIFNNLIEKEEKFNLLLKNFEILQQANQSLQYNYKFIQDNYKSVQDSNKKLQQQIKDLEIKVKESNKTYDEKIKNVITKNINSNNTINNTNTVNNIIIPSDKLVNFGKEDLSKINYVTILKKIFNPFTAGVKLFDDLLNLVHFNPNLPEFQNVYMSDRNREKYMCYEDSDWKLSESAFITIMQQINSLKEINEDKFDEILEQEQHVYKNATTKLYRDVNKYFGEDDLGKKNDEFIKLVDTKMKTTLYNNSDIPKNNFKKIKDDLIAKKYKSKKLIII